MAGSASQIMHSTHVKYGILYFTLLVQSAKYSSSQFALLS
jgi:hypothetical protein